MLATLVFSKHSIPNSLVRFLQHYRPKEKKKTHQLCWLSNRFSIKPNISFSEYRYVFHHIFSSFFIFINFKLAGSRLKKPKTVVQQQP